MKTHHFLALTALFSALVAVPVSGAVVSYHDLAGNASASANFTLTNGSGDIGLLNYADGSATGISLNINHSGSISTFNGVDIPYRGDFAALFPAVPEGDTSYRQSLYVGGGATTIFTFSGLNAGQTYDFAIFSDRGYGSAEGNASRSTTFTLAGAVSFTNASSTGTIISGDNSETTEAQNGHNPNGLLVRYSNIVPTGDAITITVTGTGYSGNALRFEIVPEPATAALTSLGALGLLLRRRSRHASA